MFGFVTSLLLSFVQVMGIGLIFYAIEWRASKTTISSFAKEEAPYFFNQLLFLITNLIVVPRVIKYLVGLFFKLTGKSYIFDITNLLPEWVLIITIFLFADLWGYWAHRLFHSKYLWKFHYSHHGLPRIHWMNAFRFHPLELAFTSATLYMMLSLFNISPYVLQSFILINSAFSMLAHTNCQWRLGPLGYILISPQFHSIHHLPKGGDYNFGGMFTFWDKFFGTEAIVEPTKEFNFRDQNYIRNMLLIQKSRHDK